MSLFVLAAVLLTIAGLALGLRAKSILFVAVLTALTLGSGHYVGGMSKAVVGALLLQCGYVVGLFLSHMVI